MNCEYCNTPLDEDNHHYFDGTSMCRECHDERVTTCEHCGQEVWTDDNSGCSRLFLCQDCYDNHYNSCESCGRTIHYDDCHYLEDDDSDAYCRECYEERHESYIESYNYRPDPDFYGQGDRYLGVELEIDNGNHRDNTAKELHQLANKNNELIYIKHDGSLDNGMEIVTHPMTLSYHKNEMPWADVVEICRKAGFRSHMASTCGLHVHVSKKGLGADFGEQEATIARVLFLIEAFWNEFLNFSRRTPSQLERWAARYGRKDSPQEVLDHAKGDNIGRYTCVNLKNYATIEFRIFRGTLKLNTLIATLEMVEHICNIAQYCTDENLQKLSWSDFVSRINEKSNPELVQYLKERRLYVNEPVENGGEV